MKQSSNTFDVTYELRIEKGISAFKVAEGICLEQTVEVDRVLQRIHLSPNRLSAKLWSLSL